MAGIGTAAVPTGTVVANERGSRRYVGKSDDPVTDVEQQDADAVLSRHSDGLEGRLDVAGFRLAFGDDNRLPDVEQHRERHAGRRYRRE
ncbi:hypothetical protein [Halorubellus salinus]|uniref:hypothetical protein n=1 Tax=Halorubellus salinus TaxID=755309 RepID=UPI001D06A985|nr:hypothetical protein [Halorubellus salinus]